MLALLLHIFIILLLVVSYLILLLPGHSNNGASLSLGLLSGLVPLLLQVLLKVTDGRLLCGVLEDELEPLLDLLCQRKNVLGLLLREVEGEDRLAFIFVLSKLAVFEDGATLIELESALLDADLGRLEVLVPQ